MQSAMNGDLLTIAVGAAGVLAEREDIPPLDANHPFSIVD